ncbi:hypothetical protein H5079_10795 [Pseudoalteromonas sp. SG44-5]|uniref:hypothetical protein n=1 Tax=unclassified Pseudoalteromonas TaxID=194690 RepID=UPI0015FD92EE|nr:MULTISPECIES: hypothetical protein [unclassified Pseudoalteromonas]MBB1406103.1 hypothetical protein [Pseudoalteromonas sp. SG44-5]MBH0093689.1 hypothetical protein [Pseudoalteromonas sp. SCQQ13]
MYLSELSIGEKKNFLELAYYAMGLNGELKEEEKEIFQSFVYECELPKYSLEKQERIDSVIKVLAKSETRNKRILLIELFGILLADGEVCDAEAQYMDKIGLAFDIDNYEIRKIQRWVEAMTDLVNEGYNILNKG